jgi:hypothetical protein
MEMGMSKTELAVLPDRVASKAAWIAALRSGAYKQITGLLRDSREKPTAFCCLGVAACLMGDGTPIYSDIREHFGISGEVETTLIAMNDDEHRSFAEIADWAETHDLETGEALGTAADTAAPVGAHTTEAR